MKNLIAIAALLFAAGVVKATEPAPEVVPYVYSAHVDRVVDADTVDVTIDLGFEIFSRQRIRLYGIDAWETRGVERPRGLLAKEWLAEQIEGEKITLQTIKDKQGKYGRYLGVLWLDKISLNEELVRLGHAEHADY